MYAGPSLPLLVLLLRVVAVAVANTLRRHAPPRFISLSSLDRSTSAPLHLSDEAVGSHHQDGTSADGRANHKLGAAGSVATSGNHDLASIAKTSAAPGAAAPIQPTLVPHATLVYIVVTAARMLLYILHLAVQRAHRERGGGGSTVKGEASAPERPLAYMSDHILLGASVSACLQVRSVFCNSNNQVK